MINKCKADLPIHPRLPSHTNTEKREMLEYFWTLESHSYSQESCHISHLYSWLWLSKQKGKQRGAPHFTHQAPSSSSFFFFFCLNSYFLWQDKIRRKKKETMAFLPRTLTLSLSNCFSFSLWVDRFQQSCFSSRSFHWHSSLLLCPQRPIDNPKITAFVLHWKLSLLFSVLSLNPGPW